MELMYDRINEYSAVTIKLASPEEIPRTPKQF